MSKLLSLLFIVCFTSAANAEEFTAYFAVPGDTISQILFDHDIGPIYGRKGYLLVTLAMNPQIVPPGDVLVPGDVVKLPIPALRTMASEGQPGINSPLPKEAPKSPAVSMPVPLVAAPVVPFTAPTPVAAPTPAALPKAQPDTGFTPSSRFQLEGGFWYYDLEGVEKANGSSGKLLSSSSPSFGATWEQFWTPKYSSMFFLDVRSIQFQPDRTGVVLGHANVINSDFGIGGKMAVTPDLKVTVRAGAEQAMSYVAASDSQLNISQVGVVFFEPGLEYKLVEKKPFAISIRGAGSIIGPGADLQTGYGYNAYLRLTQESVKANWFCEVGYNERRQNTSYLELAQKSVGLNCGYGWMP